MKKVYLLLLLCCNSIAVFATHKTYAPSTQNTFTGGGTYCQNVIATAFSFKYNTCDATSTGTGSSGVSITTTWYSTSSATATGGTVVNTSTGTSATSTTGTVTWTPPTTTTGTYYYYAVITWTGSGTCNTAGSLTTSSALQVIVNANPDPIDNFPSSALCPNASVTLTDGTTGGTWSSGTGSVATVTSTGVNSATLNAVAAGTATISYAAAGCSVTATATVNPGPAAVIVTPTIATSACGNGGVALTASGGAYSATVTALSQDFNSGLGSWTVGNTGSATNDGWATETDGWTGDGDFGAFHSPDNSGFIASMPDADDALTKTILTSPVFSLAGFNSATLTFQTAYEYYTGDNAVIVEISTNGGTSWSTLVNYLTTSVENNGGIGSYTSFVNESYSLSSYVGQTNCEIRFRYYSTWGFYWALDNINVSGIQSSSAIFTWSPNTNLTCNPCASPTATPTAPITYTVSTTANGCTSSAVTGVISIGQAPSANISPSVATTTCTSQLLTAITDIGNTYQWYNSSGVISGATNATYNAIVTGTYYVNIGQSTSSCNANSPNVVITVSPVTVSISPAGPITTCGSQMLTAVTNIGNTYQWYNSLGIITGATSNTYTLGNAGTVISSDTYSVQVTNTGLGCSATSPTTTVTLDPVPTASITTLGGITSACGGSIVMTGNTNIGDTYQWSNSSGVIGGATNATYAANVTGTYSINIKQGSTGCNTNSSTTAIIINPVPTASVSPAGAVTTCGSELLMASTDIGNQYQWYNGLGMISNATGNTYTAVNIGSVVTTNTYSVVVTNSATSCSSASAVTTVTLDPVPDATITTPGNITGSCSPITMTGNTDIGDTYQWSNSSGNINGATNSTYTATITGTYSVNIKQSATGCNNGSASLTINIIPAPSASLTPSGTVTTCGSQLLTASTDLGNAYQWYSSTSGAISGATNSTYTANNTGSVSTTTVYSVQVMNSITGCGNMSPSTTVTVNPDPSATITTPGGITSICGSSIVMTGNTNIGDTYQWSNSSGVITGATSSTYIVTVTGTYFVNIANSGTGCNANSGNTAIAINAIPTASVTPTGTVTACGSELLTVGTNIGDTYQWYSSTSGVIGGATNSTYTASNNGSVSVTAVYSVQVTNSGTTCNLTSAGTTVKLDPLPTSSVTPTGTVTACGSQVLTAGTNIGNAYQWYNTSGAISGATNSTYAAINSGSVSVTNTYSVVVTNSTTNCNSTSAGTMVILNPGPTSIVSPSGTVTACGAQVLTAVTNIGNAYQWYNTSGIIPGATNSTYTAINGGATTVTNSYSVVVTNSTTTCNSTSPATTVILNPIPTSSVTPTGTVTSCGSQLLTAGTNIGNRYQWYNGSGAINGATNNTYTVSNTGSVTTTNVYSVTVTNSTTNCNSTSPGTTVILNAIPTASVSPTGTVTACGSELLTAGTNIGDTYQWYSNTGGAIAGATNSTYTATNNGSVSTTIVYSVQVTNSTTNCNLTSAGTTVKLNPIPTSSVTPTGTVTACGSQLLTAGTNIGNRYQWYNGSGLIAGATNNTYTVNNTGSVSTTDVYSVTVTSSTTGCNSTSPGTTVILNAIPTSTVTTAGGITTNCGSLVLTGSSNIGNGYQWYNSGGVINGATNSSYTATVSSTYYMKATNTATGCNSNSASLVITINPYPVVTVTPNGPTTFCAGSSITLTASNGYSYQWQNYGVNIAGATSHSYTSSQSGIFRVILSTTVPCIDTTTTTTITVNPLPSEVITASGPLTFCSGGSVVLSAQTGLATYQWVKPVNAIFGANTNSYTATTSGSYRVAMTTNSNCRDTSIVMVVDAEPLPDNTVTVSGATTFCAGGSVTLAAPSGMASYQWHDSTSAIPGAAGQSYTTGTSGSYKVFVSNGQCSDSSVAEVITNASADTSLTIVGGYRVVSGTLTVCEGSALNLSTLAGASSYQWDSSTVMIPGANTQTYTVTESGVYTLIMNSSFGCTDSVSRSVTVDTLPLPVIFEYGYGLQTTQAYTSYQWYLNGVAIPGATSRDYLVTTEGPYTVMATDANGCAGMSASITLNSLNVGNVTGIDISLYPNPATSVVYIQSPVKVKAVVYTIEGQEVTSKADAKDIDLSRFANGTYMVKLFGEDGTLLKVSKLVKSE